MRNNEIACSPVDAPFDRVIVEDNESVRVQCSNSTDFVVGKQTNFNGPVTIINGPVQRFDDSENVVIRDRIWTRSAENALEEEAKKIPNSDLTKSPNGVSSSGENHSQLHDSQKQGVSLSNLATRPFFGIPFVVWFVIVLVIFSCLVALIVELSKQDESVETPGSQDQVFIGEDRSHRLFFKNAWGGQKASSRVAINEPVPYIIISHTVTRFCYETDTCQYLMREMQKDHMSRTPAFADIAFSFLVGGDGNIYEGRGWGVRSPHEGFVNNLNYDISFIGDFSIYDNPTPTQFDAVQKLIEYGIENCHIDADFSLIAHNSTVQTLSPGKNVYKVISQWPHFDPDPKSHIRRRITKCRQPRSGMEHIAANATAADEEPEILE